MRSKKPLEFAIDFQRFYVIFDGIHTRTSCFGAACDQADACVAFGRRDRIGAGTSRTQRRLAHPHSRMSWGGAGIDAGSVRVPAAWK